MLMEKIKEIAEYEANFLIKKLKNQYRMSYSDIGMFADNLRSEIKKKR